jgi:hypothetical protein
MLDCISWAIREYSKFPVASLWAPDLLYNNQPTHVRFVLFCSTYLRWGPVQSYDLGLIPNVLYIKYALCIDGHRVVSRRDEPYVSWASDGNATYKTLMSPIANTFYSQNMIDSSSILSIEQICLWYQNIPTSQTRAYVHDHVIETKLNEPLKNNKVLQLFLCHSSHDCSP